MNLCGVRGAISHAGKWQTLNECSLSSVNRISYTRQRLISFVYDAVADLSIYDRHALEATNTHRIRLHGKLLLCTFANVVLLLIGFVALWLLRVDCVDYFIWLC